MSAKQIPRGGRSHDHDDLSLPATEFPSIPVAAGIGREDVAIHPSGTHVGPTRTRVIGQTPSGRPEKRVSCPCGHHRYDKAEPYIEDVVACQGALPLPGRDELLETAWGGWEWYDTAEIPGIIAQWVDDSEDPTYAVAVVPAYDSPSQRRGTRRGYKMIHGQTDGGESDNTTEYEVYGSLDETPFEVSQVYLDWALRAAVGWMLHTDPAEYR